jgi:hypothetical protein
MGGDGGCGDGQVMIMEILLMTKGGLTTKFL